jgi:hypothetical protein
MRRHRSVREFTVWLLAGSCALFLGSMLVRGDARDFDGSPSAKDLLAVQIKTAPAPFDSAIANNANDMMNDGRRIFRFATFGSEAFFGRTLRLHEAIAGNKNGGVGAGVSPKGALSVGLKVDMDALPSSLVSELKAGKVNLNDPATTVALLKLNSVVGLQGFFEKSGQLRSVGVTCALCHSTVDSAFGAGIGHRLDGRANRDLNNGAILALSPDLQPVASLLGTNVPEVKSVLSAWGPGKFDAELFLDGKGFRPDHKTAAVLIPDAFNLAGVNLHTYTGWGSVTYWNAFVANLEMHGKGNFFDPRLDDAAKFPIAAKNGFGHMREPEDQDFITSKLGALQFYQLAMPSPLPPRGSFDAAAAKRGDALFAGKAQCSNCHVPPLYTEPGWNMHTAQELGIDDFQAKRSPTDRYRTTPLKGVWHRRGGFYHDGRFATLLEVVQHYNKVFDLKLSAGEMNDLVEYQKSLGGTKDQ